jgi:hypothetical protein
MPISGNTKAPTPARLNKARLGAFRLGYPAKTLSVSVAGTDRSLAFDRESVRILDAIEEDPNTATIEVFGFTPAVNEVLIIARGNTTLPQNWLFRGKITEARQLRWKLNQGRVVYRLQAVDGTPLLGTRLYTKQWTSTSATAIAQDILTFAPSGFTGNHIASGLPSVTIQFKMAPLNDALTQLCRAFGGFWYADYEDDWHVFTSETTEVPLTINANNARFYRLEYGSNIDTIRNKVWVEAMGSTVLAARVAGDTTIPVDDATSFPTGTNYANVGNQRIQFTSRVLGGSGSTSIGKNLSPGTPSAAVASGTAGRIKVGSFQYKASFVTEYGESEVGSASSAATISNVSAPGALTASVSSGTSGNLAVGSYRYRVTYVTAAGETTVGSTSGTATIAHVTAPGTVATSITPTTGGSMAVGTYFYILNYATAAGETLWTSVTQSVVVTAGNSAVAFSGIPTSSDGRVTQRKLYRTVVNPSSASIPGDYKLVTTINDNSTTTFTDTVADASLGNTAPSANTSGTGQVSLSSIPTSSDGRVTKRRIYRTFNDSDYLLLATINDNSTTSATDNTANDNLGAQPPDTNTSGSGQINVTSIPIGPAGTTARRLYRKEDVSAYYQRVATITNNSATTYTDNTSEDNLGENALISSTVEASAGDTTLRLAEMAAFSASGGWVRAGSQLLRYTDRNPSSGSGLLTGIPASGVGAIAVPVPFGDPVIVAPHLLGVTGVAYAINEGDEINNVVVREDASSQSTYGVREHYIQDRRLSVASAEVRGDAELEVYAAARQFGRFLTTDGSCKSGAQITISMSSEWGISGTFVIMSVELRMVEGKHLPERSVTFASTRGARELFAILRSLEQRQQG